MEINALFFEKQKMVPNLLKVILCLFGIFFSYQAYNEFFIKNSFANLPISNTGFFLFILLWFVMLGILFIVSITLIITNQHIIVKVYPFIQKTIPINEIQSLEITSYQVMGAGIKISSQYGTIYRVSGNQGLFITLKNGKKLLVGSKNIKKLCEVLVNNEQLKILLKNTNFK